MILSAVSLQSPASSPGFITVYSAANKCLQWGVQPPSCVCMLAIGIPPPEKPLHQLYYDHNNLAIKAIATLNVLKC